MNSETERSCGGPLSPREAGDGSLVLRSRGQDLYSRARGVQSVIDGRLRNVDERSISSATGPRSRLKRPPAVRRSQPPGASRAGATGSTACPVGEREVGPLHRCDPTLRSVAARSGMVGNIGEDLLMTMFGGGGVLDEHSHQLSHSPRKVEARATKVRVGPVGGCDGRRWIGPLPDRAGKHARYDDDVAGRDPVEGGYTSHDGRRKFPDRRPSGDLERACGAFGDVVLEVGLHVRQEIAEQLPFGKRLCKRVHYRGSTPESPERASLARLQSSRASRRR